jgi:hypothetical protein
MVTNLVAAMIKNTGEKIIKLKPGLAPYVVFCLIATAPIVIFALAILKTGFTKDAVQSIIIILAVLALFIIWFHAHQITLEASQILYKRPLLGTSKIDIASIQKAKYIHFTSKSPLAIRLAIEHNTDGEKQVTVINTKLFSRKDIKTLMDKIQSNHPETTKTVSWIS